MVSIWNWNWFRGPLARVLSARMHREVTITGDLNANIWSWNPTASVQGLHIANPVWAGKGHMADVGRVVVRLRLVPLFSGHLDLRRLEFDNPSVDLWRDRQGRATWDFSNGAQSNQPLRLPPIRNFIIRDGRLSVRDDVRKLTFNGTIAAHEHLGRRSHGFEMSGQGALNRQPFTLQVTGGPLLNIDRSKPYPFDASIRAGQTYVTAKGAVPKPFDFGDFYMNATARGPDLADLYGITGVPLPNTPPYDLHGRLSRNDRVYRIDDLGGRVGSSNLAGSLSVDAGRPRTLLKANLLSRDLDFPDLGALFGGAPKHGKIASPSQKVEAQHLAAQNRIFPDSTLDVSRIRQIDADVTYKALSIRDAPVNLKAGSTHVRLNDGLLRADPLTLDLPQGRISGYIRLDARKKTPVTNLDLRLTNARIESLIPFKVQGSTPLSAPIVGRAKLTGSGDSVHKAFADASGQVSVVAPGGEIRQSIAELMGVDVIKGLGLWNKKSQQTTPIRCAVANFDVRGGVMNTERLVFDTGPVLVTGSGQVNLGTERLDFRVQGHPKKFQLVRLLVPVDVSGPIRSPSLKIEKGKAIAQGGVAAALAAAVSPLAAILPFVDPGLAKNADCAALVTQAAQKGAPVKTAQASPRPTTTARR
ncbi:MAG: AsmA family protein [Alphaproteobacteria bacterium]|nr:AsmA family protein [Alphaproteobacteria bacterium]